MAMRSEYVIKLPGNKRLELPLGGILFLGAMGAGKSFSLAAQAYKYYVANPDALIFLIEAKAQSSDYKALESSFNYFKNLNSKRTIMNAVHFLVKELRERKKVPEDQLIELSPILVLMEDLHSLSRMLQSEADESEEGTARMEIMELLEQGPLLKMYFLATSTMIENHSVEFARAFRTSILLSPGQNKWEHLDDEDFNRAREIKNYEKGRGLLNNELVQFEILDTSTTDKKEQAKLAQSQNPYLDFIFVKTKYVPSISSNLLTAQFRGQIEDELKLTPPISFEGFQRKLKKSAVDLIRDHLVTSSSTQSSIAEYLSYDKGNFSKLLNGHADSISMDKAFEVLYLLRPKNTKINKFLTELERAVGEV
jgi:hypothetical protein